MKKSGISEEVADASGLNYINTDYVFTYHWSKYKSTKTWKTTYEFIGQKEISGKVYAGFCQTGRQFDEDTKIEDNNAEFPKTIAWMREENNKVYMILDTNLPDRCNFYWYGFRDKEIMIYDNTLKPGEQYQIFDAEYYAQIDDVKDYTTISLGVFHCGNLPAWDNGILTLESICQDNDLERIIRTYSQKKSDWWNFQNDFEGYLSSNPRQFEFVDGLGCLHGLLPFPGLFPPYPVYLSMDSDQNMNAEAPILCKVVDKNTGDIIYEKADLPKWNSIDRYYTDDNVEPKYYNIQGMKISNPTEGEVYIVRRGGKATKEVYRR